MLIDTRSPESFASGHLPGSINVGLDGRFAEYAGDVLRPGQQVVLVGDTGRGTEARVRLARIGFDDVAGAVDDVERALAEHPELAASARRLTAARGRRVARRGAGPPGRRRAQPERDHGGGTLPGARIMPLPSLLDHLGELDPSKPTIVYCAGGYRSSVAASTLRAHGFAAWPTHRWLRRLGRGRPGELSRAVPPRCSRRRSGS